MTSSKQEPIENNIDFSDLKPIEVFKYHSNASKLIYEVNYNNISEHSSQIIDLIRTSKISIKRVFNYLANFIKKYQTNSHI